MRLWREPSRGADRPRTSMSPAVRPRGIPGDDLVGGVGRLPFASRVRVDQRQAAERAPDIELIRVLGRYQERALAGATRDGRLKHTGSPGSAQGPTGLDGTTIPQRRIFRQSVVRSIPSRAAARLLFQRLDSSARSRCSLSSAARIGVLDVCGRCGWLFGLARIEQGRVPGSIMPPRGHTIACSMAFSNSRTFPGHSSCSRHRRQAPGRCPEPGADGGSLSPP